MSKSLPPLSPQMPPTAPVTSPSSPRGPVGLCPTSVGAMQRHHSDKHPSLCSLSSGNNPHRCQHSPYWIDVHSFVPASLLLQSCTMKNSILAFACPFQYHLWHLFNTQDFCWIFNQPGWNICVNEINQLYNVFFKKIELNPNHEMYRNADIRPPFTYATLIRQVRRHGFNL